jgi:hypothetical protein
VRVALLALSAALALVACDDERPRVERAPPIAIGVPMPDPGRLWAGNPAGGAGVVLERARRPGMNPRDACFRIGFEGRASSRFCAVKDPDGGVIEFDASVSGPVSVITGHAGRAVRRLFVEVEGESHELPRTRDGAFLALLPASYRGNVMLVARNGDGTVATHSFAAVRRRGVVFGGEIGKAVMDDARQAVLRHLGPPRSRDGRCWLYGEVGSPKVRWTLCFEEGRVARAWAGRLEPAH